jgi:DNA-binding protein VF530
LLFSLHFWQIATPAYISPPDYYPFATYFLLFIHSYSLSLPFMNSKDPLHGKTLEFIVSSLIDKLGFEELGEIIPINCFRSNPSLKSSLTFLRKTPWARKKVEDLYIQYFG